MTDIRTINTPAGFDELTSSNRYVLVEFCASWCGPCHAIAPVFHDLASKHHVEGRLAFAKMDVDMVPDVAEGFGINAMPTFMVLVDGKPAGDEVQAKVRTMLKGADPRALEAMAGSLGGLAKEEAEKEEEEREGVLKVDEDI